jgi:hypothetical protein
MPDGFEPHTELARIYVLKDLMQECRQKMPVILETISNCLVDVDPSIRLQAAGMLLDRGFGKPRQHVMVDDYARAATEHRRVLILPDNGRESIQIGTVIDSEAA